MDAGVGSLHGRKAISGLPLLRCMSVWVRLTRWFWQVIACLVLNAFVHVMNLLI